MNLENLAREIKACGTGQYVMHDFEITKLFPTFHGPTRRNMIIEFCKKHNFGYKPVDAYGHLFFNKPVEEHTAEITDPEKFIQKRLAQAFRALEGGSEFYPFDSMTTENIEGMRRAYADVLQFLHRNASKP
jgi:hypothetical protein